MTPEIETILCDSGPHDGLRHNVLGRAERVENVHGEKYQDTYSLTADGTPIYRHVGPAEWVRPARVTRPKKPRWGGEGGAA